MRSILTTTWSATVAIRHFGTLLLLLCMGTGTLHGQPDENRDGAFICFGDGFAFSTEPVAGWSLDQEAGRSDGLCVVGYPGNGKKYAQPMKESPAVLFAMVTTRFREGHLMSYDEVQTATADRFRETKPNLEIRNGDPIQVDGKKVVVRKYFPTPTAEQSAQTLSWDSFAYIEEPHHFISLVLSARSREEHDKAYPAFRSYVRTYKFITKLSRH